MQLSVVCSATSSSPAMQHHSLLLFFFPSCNAHMVCAVRMCARMCVVSGGDDGVPWV
jgi:hypothetical protein